MADSRMVRIVEAVPEAEQTAANAILELLYVQHYRILRRALACMGQLERGTTSNYQQVHQAVKFLGSVDAELIVARDLLEEFARRQNIPLPSRSKATEKAQGANSREARPPVQATAVPGPAEQAIS
jgi:hypothetical protein